jgi:hypothetical protein
MSHTDPLFDPVATGVAAAQRRLERHELAPLEPDAVGHVVDQALTVLAGWEWKIPPRGVELFVELVIVGASARVAFGEPALEPREITEFLPPLARMVNSIFHSPP